MERAKSSTREWERNGREEGRDRGAVFYGEKIMWKVYTVDYSRDMSVHIIWEYDWVKGIDCVQAVRQGKAKENKIPLSNFKVFEKF